MPAKSKSQQRLFSMALAVRKGDLPRSKVWKAVLDIVDSDMTNKEIEDFTVLKESNKYRTMKPIYEYITESAKEKRFFDLALDFKDRLHDGWVGVKHGNELSIYFDTDIYDLPEEFELQRMFDNIQRTLEDEGWKIVDSDITAEQPYIKVK